MTPYSWLLFDADGTLFDYDKAEIFALQQAFEQIDLPFTPEYLTRYRMINGRMWLNFERGKITVERLKIRRFENLLQELDLKMDAFTLSERYLANLSQAIFLIEHAEETVKTLAARYQIAIITNGLSTVQRPRFRDSELASYLKTTIISEEVGVAKPDPQIFEIAFEQMRNPAREEVLMIGDSLTSDIQGGYNYGIDTCWFNPAKDANTSEVEPTYEIQHLRQIFDILHYGETIMSNAYDELEEGKRLQ